MSVCFVFLSAAGVHSGDVSSFHTDIDFVEGEEGVCGIDTVKLKQWRDVISVHRWFLALFFAGN